MGAPRTELDDSPLDELLESPGLRMVVATLEPDGQPHLTVVWFCTVDDGRIAFTAQRTSRKVQNLERDPRITLLVDAGSEHGELHGAQIAGTATLDRSLETLLDIHERIAARYPTRHSTDIARTMARRTAVLVEPTRVRSWDHRRLPSR